MIFRLAGAILALGAMVLPLSAQNSGADSENPGAYAPDAAVLQDEHSGVTPSGRPGISWWDSDYWAEWEAQRAEWRSEWLDYEMRHPSRIPAELSRIIRGGSPTPHRIDGGAAALAELDYGIEPGTLTRELRWVAGYDRDSRWGSRGRLAAGAESLPGHVTGERMDANVRRALAHRRTRERLNRVRDWYRSTFGRDQRARGQEASRDDLRRRNPDGTRVRGDRRHEPDRRRTRRGGS